jgi:hypothetical protein
MHFVIESGAFKIMVGTSSEDPQMLEDTEMVEAR